MDIFQFDRIRSANITNDNFIKKFFSLQLAKHVTMSNLKITISSGLNTFFAHILFPTVISQIFALKEAQGNNKEQQLNIPKYCICSTAFFYNHLNSVCTCFNFF